MRFQKLFLKYKIKGFSILEASIVLAISSIFIAIGLFSPEFLPNLRLQADAASFFQAIKKAQSLALSPRPYGENICGFGIKITSTKDYLLFKKATSTNASDPCTLGSEIELIKYQLKPDNSFSPSSFYVLYKSPYLDTTFTTDTIIIINKNGNEKKIKIGNFGAVSVE